MLAAEAKEQQPEAWEIWEGREENDGRETQRVGIVFFCFEYSRSMIASTD